MVYSIAASCLSSTVFLVSELSRAGTGVVTSLFSSKLTRLRPNNFYQSFLTSSIYSFSMVSSTISCFAIFTTAFSAASWTEVFSPAYTFDAVSRFSDDPFVSTFSVLMLLLNWLRLVLIMKKMISEKGIEKCNESVAQAENKTTPRRKQPIKVLTSNQIKSMVYHLSNLVLQHLIYTYMKEPHSCFKSVKEGLKNEWKPPQIKPPII